MERSVRLSEVLSEPASADCYHSLDLVSSGKVDLGPLVSVRFGLDHVKEAFDLARSGNALD